VTVPPGPTSSVMVVTTVTIVPVEVFEVLVWVTENGQQSVLSPTHPIAGAQYTAGPSMRIYSGVEQ
jgi:hypothetical protein